MAELCLPRLVVLSDSTLLPAAQLLQCLEALAMRARPGTMMLTLRDYTLELGERWALGQRLARVALQCEQRFGIADRADWVRATPGAALHLPQSGIPAAEARRYLGAAALLSRGSHDPGVAPEPELDALLLSPVFEARKGRPALGLAVLAQVATRLGPGGPALYALGGVSAQNAAACLSAGAAGVAVIGAALVPDPQPLLAALGILRA